MRIQKMDLDNKSAQRRTNEVSLTFLNRARLRWMRGDLSGALEELEISIKCNSSRAGAFVLRGIILAQKGQNLEARRNIRYALLLGGSKWEYTGLVRACLKRVVKQAA